MQFTELEVVLLVAMSVLIYLIGRKDLRIASLQTENTKLRNWLFAVARKQAHLEISESGDTTTLTFVPKS